MKGSLWIVAKAVHWMWLGLDRHSGQFSVESLRVNIADELLNLDYQFLILKHVNLEFKNKQLLLVNFVLKVFLNHF